MSKPFLVLDDYLTQTKDQPWSGVPPEESVELFMVYLVCALSRDTNPESWCSNRLRLVMNKRFLYPVMDDETEELYRRVYRVFMDTSNEPGIGLQDLKRFYQMAIPKKGTSAELISLPFIGQIESQKYSWFFPNRDGNVWVSCLRRHSRLRDEIVARVGLYGSGSAYRSTGGLRAADRKTLQQLEEVDLLVDYVLQNVAHNGETGRLRREHRKLFHDRYMDILNEYARERPWTRSAEAISLELGGPQCMRVLLPENE